MFDYITEKRVQIYDGFTILIVEDSKVINNALASRLTKEGYHCLQSYTLNEARELIGTNRVDLVILDLHLPDGEGEEFVEQLKERKSSAKVVVLTSENDLFRRDELFRMGILDYLLKEKNANLTVMEIFHIIENMKMNPNYTILVVDDSHFIRKKISNILSACGYKSIEVENGEDALLKIEENKIDLVLLDKELPGIDGLAVLDKIKNNEKSIHIPVFMISNSLDIEVMRNAYKSGALDYFKKPFSPEELKLKVEQIIEQQDIKYMLRGALKAGQLCRGFFDEFYAGVIFDKDLQIKKINEKYKNEFSPNVSSLEDIFKSFSENIFNEIIKAMHEKRSYNKVIGNSSDKTYSIKLFPLNKEEFLLSFEKLTIS